MPPLSHSNLPDTSTPIPTPPNPLAAFPRSSAPDHTIAVRAFVDFWNFQIAMDRWQRRFRIDWSRLGPSLAKQVEALWSASGRPGRIRFGGLHLYISHNPAAPRDEGLRKWARDVLARFEGVHVVLRARRPKDPPSCPACHAPVAGCPRCGTSMHRTTEKGVDTAIVTDMVRLAWEGCWDVAVLVSADGDFVPAVEHLQQKGHAVVHAGFARNASALARTCCASFDMTGVLGSIERVADEHHESDLPRARKAHATAVARRVLSEKEEGREKVVREVRKTDPGGD